MVKACSIYLWVVVRYRCIEMSQGLVLYDLWFLSVGNLWLQVIHLRVLSFNE